MQKKIYIVSPHDAPNYGTMLQAYALQEALLQFGCKSEYICYSFYPRGLHLISYFLTMLYNNPQGIFRKLCGKPIGEDFRYFRENKFFLSTYEAFKTWHKLHIHYTEKIYNHTTVASLEDSASLFIVGSDQTWSPLLTKGYAAFYFNFLRFVHDNKKKNAYAPSFGTFQFSSNFKNKVVSALASFSYLSCREYKGANWLECNLNRHVEPVLDPTLLLQKEDWIKVSSPVPDMPKEYILCYQLGEKRSISEFSERISKKTGLPVYYILTRPSCLSHSNCLFGIGPGEFISLIRGASFVCTDSFHGTIFCINFNIPFFSFTKRIISDKLNDNERILNVLEEFSLKDRFRSDSDDNVNLHCSFDKANEILSYRRQKSLIFLKQIADASKSI